MRHLFAAAATATLLTFCALPASAEFLAPDLAALEIEGIATPDWTAGVREGSYIGLCTSCEGNLMLQVQILNDDGTGSRVRSGETTADRYTEIGTANAAKLGGDAAYYSTERVDFGSGAVGFLTKARTAIGDYATTYQLWSDGKQLVVKVYGSDQNAVDDVAMKAYTAAAPLSFKVSPMKAAVVVFPGSNRDRDMIAALSDVSGERPAVVWHKDAEIPAVDLIVIPGGFSYGDYLRSGAIAARSPVMDTIRERAAQGVMVLGVCNGFQVLTEAGLLPGVLMRNASLKFVCREIKLSVENTDTAFTRGYEPGQIIRCPIAHHDGNYFADAETIRQVEGNGQVAFRYAEGTNPNGSINDIAGVFNAEKNVLGLMPHPENLIESAHGGIDGRALFTGMLQQVA